MTDVILVCEDLFGLELLFLLRESNKMLEKNGEGINQIYRIHGYVSDLPDPFRGFESGLPYLGTIAAHENPERFRYVLGIAEPASKRRAVETIIERGGRFQTVFSPGMLAPNLKLGRGSVVFAYSAKAGLELGEYSTVIDAMLSCHKIGAYSTVMHFANVAGDEVGADCYIGDHSFLAVGRSVGDGAVLEPGSVAVKNVKPGVRVSGVPARRIKGRD